MVNYQQYHKYRPPSEAKGFKVGKIFLVLATIAVIYLIGRAIFGSQPEVTTTLPNENQAAGNVNVVTNEAANTNGTTNANADTNTNSNTASGVSSGGAFKVADCSRVFSRGTTSEKRVSLTFNVGTAKAGEIQKVLDTLTSTKTAADFFARGEVAESNPDLITKISSAGFPIYNFSYNHPHFNDLPESGIVEQLTKADTAIQEVTKKTTKPFFRPPYGEADADVLAAVKSAGYCPVTWTIDAMDWSADYTAEQSKERILSNVTSGAIIVMQASNATTAAVVPDVISALKDKGYTFTHLDVLLSS